MLPDRFGATDELPTALLFHLASLIQSGAKVGLASADKAVCAQARDMLMLVLTKPAGEA